MNSTVSPPPPPGLPYWHKSNMIQLEGLVILLFLGVTALGSSIWVIHELIRALSLVLRLLAFPALVGTILALFFGFCHRACSNVTPATESGMGKAGSIVITRPAPQAPVAQPTPLTPPFLMAPPEILLQIATNLDQPTARSLALTCRQLRSIAAVRLWSEIIFKLEHKPRSRDERRLKAGPTLNAPVRFRKNRHKRLYLRFMEALRGGAEGSNENLELIRSIDITLYGSIRDLYPEILGTLSPNVQRLCLRPNPFNLNRVRSRMAPLDLPMLEPITLPRLVHLTLVIVEPHMLLTIYLLMRGAPDLKILDLDVRCATRSFLEDAHCHSYPFRFKSRLIEVKFRWPSSQPRLPSIIRELLCAPPRMTRFDAWAEEGSMTTLDDAEQEALAQRFHDQIPTECCSVLSPDLPT